MEDDRIVELFFARDQQALRETQSKYSRYLQAIAYRVLGSREDSEECVNDALLSAWNAIPPKLPTVFRMFLAKLTRNHAINRRKAQNAAKRGGGEAMLAIEELEECVAGTHDTEDSAMTEELQRLIFEQRPSAELRALAREGGMRSLREDGLLKVASGMTSLDEVLRVTMGDEN